MNLETETAPLDMISSLGDGKVTNTQIQDSKRIQTTVMDSEKKTWEVVEEEAVTKDITDKADTSAQRHTHRL